MTNAFVTTEEARAFLDANRTVQWIDLLLYDMNGIARGKRVRRGDLLDVAKSGMMMPASVFIMDPRGNCIEETGRLWETGDPDHKCRMLSGTLAPVPVGAGTHAQAAIVVDGRDELCPRTVLADQVQRFSRTGRTPVVAVELEFYVTTKGANGAFTLQTPDGLSDDPEQPLTFGFDDMDALRPFIDDIYRIAEAQGLPVDAVMQESGPGQFEINLKHRDDAVAAALDGLLLKRAVKAAAQAHNLEATFMAKPHHDWAGSGMHVHLSLIDKEGENLFAGDPISTLFHQALGGLKDTMPDFRTSWPYGPSPPMPTVVTFPRPMSRWPLTGASTTATSRSASPMARARRRASSIASPAPTPTRISCSPRFWPVPITASPIASIRAPQPRVTRTVPMPHPFRRPGSTPWIASSTLPSFARRLALASRTSIPV
jgi:glutamine synthetase